MYVPDPALNGRLFGLTELAFSERTPTASSRKPVDINLVVIVKSLPTSPDGMSEWFTLTQTPVCRR